MDDKERPVAFVAMKFDNDHWRDKRYLAIREELENAGFSCVRADEINTSGYAVDEVCRLLKEADLVVIDSSGNSPNVSYEIGYCHGIGRSPRKTLLLSSDPDIPFNYRQYRYRVYKDLRHLRRLVRDYLKIYEPITDDMYGYAFGFEYSESVGFGYILEGAICVFEALQQKGFTGRAECYSAEHFYTGERLFTVGLVLRQPGKNPTPNYKWWKALSVLVSGFADKKEGRIRFDSDTSELASKRAMKHDFLPSGVAEFNEGSITRLLEYDPEYGDSSFFAAWVKQEAEPADAGSE